MRSIHLSVRPFFLESRRQSMLTHLHTCFGLLRRQLLKNTVVKWNSSVSLSRNQMLWCQVFNSGQLKDFKKHFVHKFNNPYNYNPSVICAGPGSYNVLEHGLAQESFKKAFLERTRKGGFGSSAQRNFIFPNRESIEAPSPGQYEVRSSISKVIHLLFVSFCNRKMPPSQRGKNMKLECVWTKNIKKAAQIVQNLQPYLGS